MKDLFIFFGIIGGTFLLEDPTTLAVGSLIANKEVSFAFGFLALSLGIFLGDLGLYFFGYLCRRKIFSSKKTFFAPVTSQIAVARFLPGARTITFLAAGYDGFPLGKFLLIIFPSSVVWTLLLLSFTEQIFQLTNILPVWGNWLAGIFLLILVANLRTLMKVCSMAVLIVTVLLHHGLFFDRRDRKKLSRSLSRYCKLALRILDIEVTSNIDETDMAGKLVLSNHLSYLDVICLSSLYPSIYVTSVEIKETPLLGLICDLCGCLFTERRRSLRSPDLLEKELAGIQEVLDEGISLTLFPEGTSTNGETILPFKTTLLEGAVRSHVSVIPVLIRVEEVNGEKRSVKNADIVCWYGSMSFTPHFLKLCQSKGIKIRLTAMSQLETKNFSDRKELAAVAARSLHLSLEGHL